MEPGVSDRACERCRQRRVKCDKRQPSCGRCEKLSKPCPGYDRKRKFVDEGANLRKKYQGLADSSPGREGSSGPSHGSTHSMEVESPRVRSSIALPVSRPCLQWSNAQSPAEALTGADAPRGIDNLDNRNGETSLQPPRPASTANGLLSRSLVSNLGHDVSARPRLPDVPIGPEGDATLLDMWSADATFDPELFDIEPAAFYASGENSCGFVSSMPTLIDEVDRMKPEMNQGSDIPSINGQSSLNKRSSQWPGSGQLQTSCLLSEERDHEMAYLIRHFTEAIGPMMDLFDSEKHFGQFVPLRALRDALLRNAIAAVAAKQLGRTRGSKPFVSTQRQKPAMMEDFQESVQVDWFYKAANYYDKAIACSRMYLQALHGKLSSLEPHDKSVVDKDHTTGPISLVEGPHSDDLLVAVSIFSLYESLESMTFGWLQHLSGLKSLLMLPGTGALGVANLEFRLTSARSASFWNFARADYQAAYINHTPTLLDTNDICLWHDYGLQISRDGPLYSQFEAGKSSNAHGHHNVELVSHTLLWIVLRLMNQVTNEHDLPINVLQAGWQQLSDHLDEWRTTLPDTFQPCAQVRHTTKTVLGQGIRHSLTEVFFSIDTCAATMQLYYFACILLLVHKPADIQHSDGGRLRAHREFAVETIRHSREIVGIALGRPHLAVRAEMVQPLYLAGMCLESEEERRIVLELLKAIQADTGCCTDARVQRLLTEWDWNSAV